MQAFKHLLATLLEQTLDDQSWKRDCRLQHVNSSFPVDGTLLVYRFQDLLEILEKLLQYSFPLCMLSYLPLIL